MQDISSMHKTDKAAEVFNQLILSYVFFALNKLHIFSLLQDTSLPFTTLLQTSRADEQKLRYLLSIALRAGIFTQQSDVWSLTSFGQEMVRYRGFFSWAIGGYSPLLESLDTFAQNPTQAWQPFVRGEYVAIGSDEANVELMQKTFDEVMKKYQVSCIADLGCGNAGRLVRILQKNQQMTGVGIDINPQAIEVATQLATQNGVKDRLQLVCQNVFTTLDKADPALQKVELVMSFMMLHDLFNIPELKGKLFSVMKEAFPNAKYFVFADTCFSQQDASLSDTPVFTLGYELVHEFRNIELFPLSYYQQQFNDSGLKLIAQHDFGVPYTYLFVLERE